MQNWYCLVNFPDQTQGIHIVPGPAPVYGEETIKILDKPGIWYLLDLTVRVPYGADYAAEIWVRPATDEEVRRSGRVAETRG